MIRSITTFRNPIASIWQHAIHKVITQRQPNARLDLSANQPEMTQFAAALTALQAGEPIPLVDTIGTVIGDCAKLAAAYVWAEIRKDSAKASALEDQLRYGTCDLLWSIALAIYLSWKASLEPIPYVRYSNMNDFVIPLPDETDLTIGLIADWGTGLDDAKWLLSEVMSKKPDVLIHLGDVYYAGTADENRSNFLNLVNNAAPGIPVYTMSGNHDMYSGGHPYYWLLSQLNIDPQLVQFQQKASYFCLRNTDWQILAMDTGLHDNDPSSVTTNLTFLDDQEANWHVDKLKNAGNRKTVLLSHHQLFTAFGDGLGQGPNGRPLAFNPNLYRVFAPYLNNVAIWLWGHEHNFEFFKPYLGLNKGRCIGASAIPCLESQNPYGLIEDPDLQGQDGLPGHEPGMLELTLGNDGVYFHNYAILTLRTSASAIKDSKIEYYELDSPNHGPSVLMGGEMIP
jgi:predicted phosphodiesterase